MTGRKKTGRKSGEGPDLTPDDAELWSRVTNTTKPLPGRGPAKPANKEVRHRSSSSIPDERPSQKQLAIPPNGALPAGRGAAMPDLAYNKSPSLDRRTSEKLRRGQLPIEARLDMHGMTQAKAKTSLLSFILRAYNSGLRCVLVITGKGSSSKGTGEDAVWLQAESGVLREATPQWLNDPAIRPKILSFCQARPKDGGQGALYVLLKRQRS